MARTSVATEAFTYSDGNLESVSGGNWVSLNPLNSSPIVASNKFKGQHSSHAVARWTGAGSFDADQYAKIVISNLGSTTQIGKTIGVVVRATGDKDGNRDYYAALVCGDSGSGNTTLVVKVANGSASNLSSVTGDGWADGNTVELEAVTNGANCDLNVYRNGVLLRTVTDSSSPLTGTSTAPGVIGQDNVLLGDDWEGGNITASGDAEAALSGSASTSQQTTPAVGTTVAL